MAYVSFLCYCCEERARTTLSSRLPDKRTASSAPQSLGQIKRAIVYCCPCRQCRLGRVAERAIKRYGICILFARHDSSRRQLKRRARPQVVSKDNDDDDDKDSFAATCCCLLCRRAEFKYFFAASIWRVILMNKISHQQSVRAAATTNCQR